MVTWQQIGQGEPNPFDVTYTNNSTYSASYGEFVITEGSQVDLPAPSENSAVAVRSFEQEVTITTPSGNIWDSASTGKVNFNSPKYVILVSDGTNWYVQNNESAIEPVIPDSEIDRFEWGGPVSDRYTVTKSAGVIGTSVDAIQGDYTLYYPDSDDTGEGIIIHSYPNVSYTDGGLPNYPQPGDKIGGFVYIRTETAQVNRDANPQIEFAAVENEDSAYVVAFDGRNNEISISKRAQGSKTALNSKSISHTTPEWYYLQIDYSYDSTNDETTIQYTAYNTDSNNEPVLDTPKASIQTTDSEPVLQDNGDGGFGFRDTDTYISVFDDWNLTRGGSDV